MRRSQLRFAGAAARKHLRGVRKLEWDRCFRSLGQGSLLRACFGAHESLFEKCQHRFGLPPR